MKSTDTDRSHENRSIAQSGASRPSDSPSANFDWLARRYDNVRGGQSRVLDIKATLNIWIPTEGVILDIGAGTGAIAASLATPGRSLIALDISREMVLLSAKRLGVITLQGSAERLPIAKNTVTAALMIWTLNHFGNPSAAISEAARVICPDGRLILMDGVPLVRQTDILARHLSKLDGLRHTKRLHDATEITSLASGNELELLFSGNHVARFRQRPNGLADRIERRDYAFLCNLSTSTWDNVVAPVIDALRTMENPDEYRDRINTHRYWIFQAKGI